MNSKERYLLRFDMRADAGEEAEVMVYSAIESDKWFDDDVTPNDFDKALKAAVNNGAKKLNIRVNSPGGDVYSAVAMRSMVMNAGFKEVRVMIEGLCASAATLFATIPGANVVIADGSEFMIHNPMTFAIGNADDLEGTVNHLRKLEGQFHEMYAAKTGQDESVIKGWMDAETWFTAKEAVANGFCDEVLESAPVAACVSARDMSAMKAMYRAVPQEIEVADDGPEDGEDMYSAVYEISNEAPAGAPTEIQNPEEEESQDMDIKDIDMDQLRAENPALLEQIQQAALTAERQRQEDIDAITPPAAEYQAMAEEAKKKGTPFTEYQRALVAAQKQKGANHLAARQEETAPAQNIAGGAAETPKNEDEEIKQNAEDMAKYAKEYRGNADGGMY